MLNTHAPVSRRGQWRDQLSVYSPNGATDPSLCVYSFVAWPLDGGSRDGGYGRFFCTDAPALSADTVDGTGRLVAVQASNALVLAWLFPVEEMGRLEPGAYQASITASLSGEVAELKRFSFVVDAGPAYRAPAQAVTPAPDPEPSFAIDVQEF